MWSPHSGNPEIGAAASITSSYHPELTKHSFIKEQCSISGVYEARDYFLSDQIRDADRTWAEASIEVKPHYDQSHVSPSKVIL